MKAGEVIPANHAKADNVYFIGIGGIGMSAIARYFKHEGRNVAGYDRTPTPLTSRLAEEGIPVHFTDNPVLIPAQFRDPAATLVVYTPAVPSDHSELFWFREMGFAVEKRSEVLGHMARGKYLMAVAGTHGKTTVSTLVAWLNHCSASGGRGGNGGGSAFLGGISRNFDSNVVTGDGLRLVAEADEFDRSFLRLYPDAAVITSADADHLDIYGSGEAFREAFSAFARQVKTGGALIIKTGVELDIPEGGASGASVYRYSCDEPCDFYARNIVLREGGYYFFDIFCPDRTICGCTLGVPGRINVENAVAAVALMWVAGFDEEKLKKALASFSGIKRRFEIYINTPDLVYMDDYAHHPRELTAAITSIREMFPHRKLTSVFQPHLYTRTRDFHAEFAQALSLSDDVILLPVYPARELPIEGVSSEMIARDVTVPCQLIPKQRLTEELSGGDNDVVVTFGAGDIGELCDEVAEVLKRFA